MKTTRKPEESNTFWSVKYEDFPKDGTKVATIKEWENGGGYDVTLGGDSIELTNQEIAVLQLLFAKSKLIT